MQKALTSPTPLKWSTTIQDALVMKRRLFLLLPHLVPLVLHEVRTGLPRRSLLLLASKRNLWTVWALSILSTTYSISHHFVVVHAQDAHWGHEHMQEPTVKTPVKRVATCSHHAKLSRRDSPRQTRIFHKNSRRVNIKLTVRRQT